MLSSSHATELIVSSEDRLRLVETYVDRKSFSLGKDSNMLSFELPDVFVADMIKNEDVSDSIRKSLNSSLSSLFEQRKDMHNSTFGKDFSALLLLIQP